MHLLPQNAILISSNTAGPRRQRRFLRSLLVFFLLSIFAGNDASAGVLKWKDDQGKWHFTDSPANVPAKYRDQIPKPKTPAKEVAPAPQGAPAPESPPPAKPTLASEEISPDGEVVVRFSIGKGGFVPALMKVAAVDHPAIRLSGSKPKTPIAEPAYRGTVQKYGSLQLGTAKNNSYVFALDVVEGSNPVLYFDTNQNGDLTDDGEPLTNRGTTLFATAISIPFKQIIKETELPGDYVLWFFTNPRLWELDSVTYYSRSQLQGKIIFGGREYLVYLADYTNNDADFTNDGINIDLDGDGKIDRASEYFKHGKTAEIDGLRYRFKVQW
ncbi:MAG: DUF4124 domain-containing protein [Nitrospinae bacterium]|nr:DUF4124 domain-containing protein [Nitrospinota bacterium]